MLERRNFIWAGVMSLIGAVTGKTRATVEEKPTPVPEDIKDLKILVVTGGVIPGALVSWPRGPLHPPHIRPMARTEDRRHRQSDDNGLWYEMLPDKDMMADGVFPRGKSFRMVGDAHLGTVEELVAHYRAQMIKAATAWAEGGRRVTKDEFDATQKLFQSMESGPIPFEKEYGDHHMAFIRKRAEMGYMPSAQPDEIYWEDFPWDGVGRIKREAYILHFGDVAKDIDECRTHVCDWLIKILQDWKTPPTAAETLWLTHFAAMWAPCEQTKFFNALLETVV